MKKTPAILTFSLGRGRTISDIIEKSKILKGLSETTRGELFSLKPHRVMGRLRLNLQRNHIRLKMRARFSNLLPRDTGFYLFTRKGELAAVDVHTQSL